MWGYMARTVVCHVLKPAGPGNVISTRATVSNVIQKIMVIPAIRGVPVIVTSVIKVPDSVMGATMGNMARTVI